MTQHIRTQCCIAGGGPAGMMLGYLLARAGVQVLVLEKHHDFLRDFRGDTIHPSTLTVLDDLGLLDEFLALPHDEVRELSGEVYGQPVTLADFRHVPAARQFMVLVPQWDFLDFLARRAKAFPSFSLRMDAQVTGLTQDGARVTGVQVQQGGEAFTVTADLVVGADGRHTTVREAAGLPTQALGVPIDVLWFRVPRDAADPSRTGGIIQPGAMLVTLNRDTYWQCAYVIPKDGYGQVRAEGLDAFRERIAAVAPFLADSVHAIGGWDDVKLLGVQVDRMPQWAREGLLCIGDAAHAMSPVGGVGINLAIQDAVAAANLLAVPLREGRVALGDLEAVQKRREWPAKVTQRVQVALHEELLSPVLARTQAPSGVPLPVRLLQRLPMLRRLPARMVGIGVRPERVQSPDVHPASPGGQPPLR